MVTPDATKTTSGAICQLAVTSWRSPRERVCRVTAQDYVRRARSGPAFLQENGAECLHHPHESETAMSTRTTFFRSMHDVGLAAWFGGSLMGAVGLNGAAAAAADPRERLRLSSKGWQR